MWECFQDLSYFDLWAVRKIGEKNFYSSYHVHNKEEAMHLTALLNDYEHRIKFYESKETL